MRFFIFMLATCAFAATQLDYVKQIANKPTRDVRAYGAKGNGSTDDTTAIQAAITATCAAGGGTVFFPSGVYKTTATITISCNSAGPANIMLLGSGQGNTRFYRDTNFGSTLSVQLYGSNTFISGVVIRDMTFSRDSGVAMTSGQYITFSGVENAEISNVVLESIYEGILFRGGGDIKLSHITGSGFYAQAGGSHYSIKTEYYTSARTRIPTHLFFDSVQFNSSRVGGPAYQLWVTSGETWGVTNSYFGQATFANVLIEQDASTNSIILDLDFGPKFYIDGAGKYGVYITGGGVPSTMTWTGVARSGGNGDTDIQNIKFIGGTIKGQEGDSTDCVYVDGTARGSSYPQAVDGLSFVGVTVEGCAQHGINAQGGNGIRVAASQIHGNNYTNVLNGNGVVIGPGTYRMSVIGNKIGGDGWNRGGALAYQKYGIQTVSGAAGFVVSSNDLSDNATGTISFGSTNGLVFNPYDGTRWDVNHYSDGLVSIGRDNNLGSLHVRPVADAVNVLEAQGAVTGSSPIIAATGSDTNIDVRLAAKGAGVVSIESPAFHAARILSSLGTPSNGTVVYCSDCTVTSGSDNTCAGSGTGALAVRLNGAWRCFQAQN